jgi:hypothetical protein
MRRRLEMPEHHLRVVRALQAGGPAVPDTLHVPLVVIPRRRLRPALAGAVATAMAAIVLVLALTLGGPSAPTTVDAAELSPLGSERPPAHSFAGVTYPNWGRRFGWFSVGARDDELGGRRTTTVFYRHTHHRIGYTVISGRPIEPPARAEVVTVNGVELRRFKLGAQDVVTFVRNGHTCVLSGEVHHASTLVKLASADVGNNAGRRPSDRS